MDAMDGGAALRMICVFVTGTGKEMIVAREFVLLVKLM
jgi:hypothetical protein